MWVDASEALPFDADNATDFLLEHGVGVMDGKPFGATPGCFRLNFACPRATLDEGLERIRNAFAAGP